MSRGPGENPAHQEAEYPAHHADANEQGPVPGQFPARDPEREVVDGLLQNPGGGQGNAGGGDHGEKALDEVAPIRLQVGKEAAEG